MSDTYYWRRRKQVQGPFDAVKMKEFYDNGALNATHEISADGTTWFPAGELIGAWANEPIDYGGSGEPSGGSGDLMLADDQWHFEQQGTAQGPISFVQLQQLLAAGQIAPNSRVWQKGMDEWLPAASIPGLIPAQVIGGTSETEAKTKKGASAKVFGALGESRPWATFLAIVMLIGGGLGIIGGIVIFIQGAKIESEFLIGQGIGSMIGSGTTVTVAILLLSFSSLANTAQIERTDKSLIDALNALRKYFAAQGLVVLLMLSMILLLVIMQAALQ